MPNPTADFPSSLHSATDTTAFSSSNLGATTPTHTQVEGKQEEEIRAIQTKIGTGSSTPDDGMVLFSPGAGLSEWRELTDLGISATVALDDVTDVTLTTPADGHYLRYNGALWVNSAIQASDLPSSIDATKIGAGGVTSTEFGYLAGVTSDIQAQFTAKQDSITAGDGLTKTGATLDVGAGTGISVGANSVAIDTSYTDTRYVNVTGDTMTAALHVNISGTPSGAIRPITLSTDGGTSPGFRLYKTDQSTTAGWDFIYGWDSSNHGFNIHYATNSGPVLYAANDGRIIVGSTDSFLAPFTNTRLSVKSNSATSIPLAVRGSGSQSANLFEAQSTGSTILALIDSSGNIRTGGYLGVGSTSAPSNTTAGDLTFIRGFGDSASLNKDLTVNESGGDFDTRIEGDTDINLLFLDASADKIGIGNNSPGTKLNIGTAFTDMGANTLGVSIQYAGGDTAPIGMYIQNTGASAVGGGAGFVMSHQDGAAMGNGERLGFMLWAGGTGSGLANTAGFTVFTTEAWGVGRGTEIRVETVRAGQTTRAVSSIFRADGGLIVNEQGADSDTRIEGDTDANLLYIDAGADRVGIGNAAPDEKLHVTGNVKASGTGLFGGDVTVPDEVYGAGWDGSLEVPTKNAVYDKIETVTAGSGITESLAIAYAVAL